MNNEPETRNQEPETPKGLAGYRADRDDFSRLLYLVLQEMRAQKNSCEQAPATPDATA